MQQLGRYELVKVVGVGGMAEVFDAYSVGAGGFRRRVALKRLLPFVADDAAIVRMFFDEARICSALHHPGIVSIVDFGVVDGVPFQVMEFVDGPNAGQAARKLARRGAPMPEVIALHICRAVAHALAYAHAASDAEGPLGIVHRDVKPGNVLLSWEGDVKVADFGIALGRVRSERTEAGHVKGTASFMAPEQLTKQAVDGRADVFALGCVLHYFLAGKSPMTTLGSSAGLLLGEQTPIDPTIAADVAGVIRTATKGSPADRFASMMAMAEALDALLELRGARDLQRDLAAWLTPLRAEWASTEQRGSVGLELTPASGSTGERAFVTRRMVQVENPKIQAPHRPAWWAALLAFGVLVAAIVVAVRVGRREPQPIGGTSARPLASSEAPSRTPPLVSHGADDATEPAVRASGAPSTTGGPTGVAMPSVVRSTPTRAPVASAPEGTGFVRFRVSGEGTATQILVDGVPRGFAPRILELPIGSHKIAFAEGDRTFGARSIDVGIEFSRRAPKDIEVPSAP